MRTTSFPGRSHVAIGCAAFVGLVLSFLPPSVRSQDTASLGAAIRTRMQGFIDEGEIAGAVTVGGHTVRDAEIKFGLSVTGLVDPALMLTNAGARPGDALVLTKPQSDSIVEIFDAFALVRR